MVRKTSTCFFFLPFSCYGPFVYICAKLFAIYVFKFEYEAVCVSLVESEWKKGMVRFLVWKACWNLNVHGVHIMFIIFLSFLWFWFWNLELEEGIRVCVRVCGCQSLAAFLTPEQCFYNRISLIHSKDQNTPAENLEKKLYKGLIE